jgi:hypothetical protein
LEYDVQHQAGRREGDAVLKWLRKILKKWLADEPAQVDALECLIDGKVRRCGVIGAVGTMLLVSDGQHECLIGPEKAVNRHLFWLAWGQRSDGDLIWDDGTPFHPEET